ncbi:BTB/POZ domain protein, partial [Cooperia oncophora]
MFSFQSSNHIRHLSTQLTQLREDSQLCDAVLVVKGARMKAHRVVLAACSNYFKAMFTADMAESCSPRMFTIRNFCRSTLRIIVVLYFCVGLP